MTLRCLLWNLPKAIQTSSPVLGKESSCSSLQKEFCSSLGSGTDICLAKGGSEPAHALLLLSRQFYGAPLAGAGVYPLGKIILSKFYAGHSLKKECYRLL